MHKLRNIFWMAVSLFILTPRTFVWAQTTGMGSGGGTGVITLTNPFKGGSSLYAFIRTVINDIILPLGGVIVVVMLIYSGFLFVTARGNTTQLATAKKNFLYVVIGTAILLGAWTIALVIENTIAQLRA